MRERLASEPFRGRQQSGELRGPPGRMIEWSAMDFFFVRDYRNRPRFYSAGPLGPLPVNFSKTRTVWETAKKKVTNLSPRLLLQEQAFEHGGRPGQSPLRILHSCLLYTSPSPRDRQKSRMPSSA